MKIYTIGVYGTTSAAFFDALEGARIDVVLDIRRRRAVRGPYYTFANAQRLTDELAERNIQYMHVLGLAPDLETLKIQSQADADAKRLKSERDELSPQYVKQYVARTLNRFDFSALARDLHGFRAPLLFCIERIPQACHRSLVAPKLAQALGGGEIVHLMPETAAFNARQALEAVRRRKAAVRKRYG